MMMRGYRPDWRFDQILTEVAALGIEAGIRANGHEPLGSWSWLENVLMSGVVSNGYDHLTEDAKQQLLDVANVRAIERIVESLPEEGAGLTG